MNQFGFSTVHDVVVQFNDIFSENSVVIDGATFQEGDYRFSLAWNEDDCEYDVTIEVVK